MNKIKVMVEKEIDIEELIEKLEELDIVDYDEYEDDPIPQYDLHSEVLAVLNNISKVMYEKDKEFREIYTASQELQTKLNESEERLKCAKKQIAELEKQGKCDSYKKMKKEIEILRTYVPHCFGKYTLNSQSCCKLCDYCEKCEVVTNA